MKLEVVIKLKPEVLDAAGRQVQAALNRLGFSGIRDCRVGRVVELDLEEEDWEKAREAAEQMARTLLANLVIEDFEIRRAQ